jgi:hypothetical protein
VPKTPVLSLVTVGGDAPNRIRPGSFQCLIGGYVEYVRLGVHIWVSVLILGTMWRLLQYHLVASDNTAWQHVGRAMALQY